ncbi:MAG TPA: cupin domain-containing protein [Methylovirgula sp.]|nr:cupin domain-containing protein [Methylovirgula sp.]
MNNSNPRVSYWHLWTDPSGMSRQTRCAMTEFEPIGFKLGASCWQSKKLNDRASVFTTILPVGWISGWQENPSPRWIIPLSGRWAVESMDGQRVEMGPGEILFGDDQNTKEREGRRGHRAAAVGDKPAVLMIVEFEALAQSISPCRFR